MILRKSNVKDRETPYSFQDRFQGIKRIAIIYPEHKKWLRIARYTLQKMYNLPERFEFLLLTPSTSSRPALNIDFEYADMNYAPIDEERSRIQNRIAVFNPDMLLQLEPSPGKQMINLIKQHSM